MLVHLGALPSSTSKTGAYFELAIAQCLAVYLTGQSIACIAWWLVGIRKSRSTVSHIGQSTQAQF